MPEPKQKQKRKRTPAERRARRKWRKENMIVCIHGRQKWVPRPQLIDGMPVDDFIAENADPMWLHQNELWHLIDSDDDHQ